MKNRWRTLKLSSEQDVFKILSELDEKHWLFRGQTKCIKKLIPTIDRGKLKRIDRHQKLSCERSSIDTFRNSVEYFSSIGEHNAKYDDVIALMVLQHYGVPTRLLDWSKSPYIALHFAICGEDNKDAELWAFSHDDYVQKGKQQWRTFPENTTDGTGDDDKFDAKLTAFSMYEPNPWIIAAFYPEGFPRQERQQGLYTMTPHFCVDHAIELEKLLKNPELFMRLVIKSKLKPALRLHLSEKFGIWKGFLFPDTAGAANTAKEDSFVNFL